MINSPNSNLDEVNSPSPNLDEEIESIDDLFFESNIQESNIQDT